MTFSDIAAVKGHLTTTSPMFFHQVGVRLKWLAGPAVVLGLLVFPNYARSQGSPGPRPQILATGGVLSTLLAAPVVGQPYTATQVHSTKRTLADGSTIAHHGQHSIARDAEGRVRVELRMAHGQNGGPDEAMVFVMDPVAHTLTTWMANAPVPTKTATVFKMPVQGPSTPPTSQATASVEAARPEITSTDLGTRSIQGLEVSGTRTTTLIAVGEAGNSAPITRVHDVWMSSLLQLVLEQHWTDPRSGERTVALADISRTEPSPALFLPPAGFAVKSALQSLKDLEDRLSSMQQ